MNAHVETEMQSVRDMFGDTISENGYAYIASCMNCAVASALREHVETSNRILRDMKMEDDGA